MGILLKPIVTEKMTAQGEKLNRYGFIVDRKANKLQIKSAVEQMYGVSVAEVNTLNYHGKRKQRYTKSGLQRGRITTSRRPMSRSPARTRLISTLISKRRK